MAVRAGASVAVGVGFGASVGVDVGAASVGVGVGTSSVGVGVGVTAVGVSVGASLVGVAVAVAPRTVVGEVVGISYVAVLGAGFSRTQLVVPPITKAAKAINVTKEIIFSLIMPPLQVMSCGST